MQKITQGTFERAEKCPTGTSLYASYGNSLFVRSTTLVVLSSGTGYLCYYDSKINEYSYYKGPASVAAEEFLDFEDCAMEYSCENSTFAGVC